MTPRKPALGFIFVTLVLDILGIGLIIPILPKLVENLAGGGVSEASHAFGLLAALYSLMQFVFAPILGSLSDRFGRRKVILISLFGSGLDYLLLAWAPTLPWFFVGRVIAGITGANFAAATAYIADVSPPEKRAANFGLIGAAFGLGFIIGPALGGVLGAYGLRVPFMVAGGLTLLNWLYGWFVLPESLAPTNRRAFSWARANPVGALIYLRTHPVAFGLTGTFFLVNLAHQVLPSTWVLYTGYRYGWTVKETGISLAIVGLTSAIVQAGLTRVIVRKIGEARSAVLGLTVASISYLCYGLAEHGWMIYVILVGASLGGVTGPAVQGLISRSVPANEQGGIQGSLTSLASVSGILGPPLATGLFGYFISRSAPIQLPGAAFFFSAALTATALVLALRLFRRKGHIHPGER
ncbi:MAG TPA: TCR/Tet family MFS transporter [Roseimicrobium sp.]|nr:TCR/Tet family MFS transporter [Roseimicrobium sp.]